MKKNGNIDELSRLRAENESLYRRIDELEARLEELQPRSLRSKEEDNVSKEWHKAIRTESLMHSKYYSKFLLREVKSTSFWAIYSRFLSYFRKYRVLSGTFRILTLIITWAETGAVFFVSVSALIIILPIMLVLSALTLMLALLRGRTANRKIAETVKDKTVYVLFGSKKQIKEKKAGFLYKNASTLASDGNICLIVSPHFFRRRGLCSKSAYVTWRCEEDGIYMLRKNYFFLLRRTVLGKKEDVVYIY